MISPYPCACVKSRSGGNRDFLITKNTVNFYAPLSASQTQQAEVGPRSAGRVHWSSYQEVEEAGNERREGNEIIKVDGIDEQMYKAFNTLKG